MALNIVFPAGTGPLLMRPPEGNLIEVRSLRQAFGGQEILRGVDLDIPKAKPLVLLGQSGGGKSVFLRHLIGLLEAGRRDPSAWRARRSRASTRRELEPVRRKIGMLFQDGALFDSMTVFENISSPCRERGARDEKVIRSKVGEALELVALSGQEAKDAREPQRRDAQAGGAGTGDHFRAFLHPL